MKKPSVAVPLVLRRLRAKLDEWREAQKNYNRLWREQCDKNHAKWLQSQAATIRQVDARQMRTKTLLNEADTASEEVSPSQYCCCCWQGSEKPWFFKKAQPTGFLGFIGFWALLGFSDFYSNEQLGGSSAKLFLDSPVF